jgi:hypothetical protein
MLIPVELKNHWKTLSRGKQTLHLEFVPLDEPVALSSFSYTNKYVLDIQELLNMDNDYKQETEFVR